MLYKKAGPDSARVNDHKRKKKIQKAKQDKNLCSKLKGTKQI